MIIHGSLLSRIMGDGENLGRKENKKREVSVREIKRQRERQREKRER